MKGMQKVFKALNISYKVMFFGTDEEIEQAENLENKRMNEIEKIIFDPNFYAIEYFNSWNQRRILHRSTREGVMFQLSYIDADGIPAMHENFIQISDKHVDEAIHDKRELLKHYLHASNDDDLILNIYRKWEQIA